MSSSNIAELEAQALAELEEEYQKELERNAAALRLLKARIEEAKVAKSRASLSQEKMECMKVKFSHVHNKLEYAKETLKGAQERMERNNQLQETVHNLKVKAEELGVKTWSITEKRQALGDTIVGNNSQETETDEDHSNADAKALLFACPDFDFPKPLIDYAAEEEKEQKISSQETEETQTESSQMMPASKLDETVADEPKKLPEQDHETEDALAIFTESVQKTEARCAGIHEELTRMALSEQYMRTKQAQLLAKKKEMAAKEAMERAEIREREAAEMRRKVGEMMKLLSDRKNKLKTTEVVIDKKGKTVDNINKILNRKHRREDHIEKEKVDRLLFGKKK